MARLLYVCLMLLSTILTAGSEEKAPTIPQAAEKIKKELAFGVPSSEMHVFYYSDWGCPMCQVLEPKLEELITPLFQKATVHFIDAFIHYISLVYTPFDVSFMLYNKPQYFKLRSALSDLSKKNDDPTEAQISTAVKILGVNYKQVPYKDYILATAVFSNTANQFKLDKTPTLLIYNARTKGQEKLIGISMINAKTIKEKFDSLQKGN